MNTLHCALENGANLYINERKKEECQIAIIYFSRCVRKLALYGDVIHSIDWN